MSASSLPTPPELEHAAAQPQAQPADTPGARLQRLWDRLGVDRLWFSVAAIALGLRAQGMLIQHQPDVGGATRWYTASAVVLLLGWTGSQPGRTLLRLPARRPDWFPAIPATALATAGWAIVWNAVAVALLWRNWSSLSGGLLWAGSLILLLVAVWRLGGDSRPEVALEGQATEAPWRLPRAAEAAVFAGIVLFALALRLYRLGELAPGMHGDEGEAGTQALAILHGSFVSPFLRGWFNQPNIYYWTIAAFMKVFGTGLFGLRTFPVFCGVLTIAFLYLLMRELFGTRAAIFAGLFASFGSADILFSRQEFSNDTLPPLFTMTFYFLVLGMRTRRHLHWAIAGLLSGLALYYFAGGRLVAPVACLFIAYVALRSRPFLRTYWTQVIAFGLGLVLISTPWIALYIAVPIPTSSYPNDRFIWLHPDQMQALYHTTSPVQVLWGQLLTTLSIITTRADNSAMGALDFTIARPLEAVLIILGLVWAAWRLLADTRFGLLSIWFWTSIIAGGVLTTDAPNLPRIVGILPVLAALIAVILDQVAAQVVQAGRDARLPRVPGGLVQWVAAAVLLAVTAISFTQNWKLWAGYYLNTRQNPIVTGQAQYVQERGNAYRFYGVGAHIVYWTHGDNRFINADADGTDAANVNTYLPIIDNGPDADKSADFLVWSWNVDYLDVLRAYYPEGRIDRFNLSDPWNDTSPLMGYIVTAKQIAARRTVRVTYTRAAGTPLTRRVASVGLYRGAAPPAGLRYPATAVWSGDVVAPMYATYLWTLSAPRGTTMTLDGVRVFPGGSRTGAVLSRQLVMAAGPHEIRLSGVLSSARTRIDLRWNGSGALAPVPRRLLWDGHTGRNWLGVITPTQPGGVGFARLDGFLGYRLVQQAFNPDVSLKGIWTATLRVRSGGMYGFQLNSVNSSAMYLDGHRIIENIVSGTAPHEQSWALPLARGLHHLRVEYETNGGIGMLELRWAPPGRGWQFFMTPDLAPGGPGVWLPGKEPVRAQNAPAPASESPSTSLGTSG